MVVDEWNELPLEAVQTEGLNWVKKVIGPLFRKMRGLTISQRKFLAPLLMGTEGITASCGECFTDLGKLTLLYSTLP